MNQIYVVAVNDTFVTKYVLFTFRKSYLFLADAPRPLGHGRRSWRPVELVRELRHLFLPTTRQALTVVE